MSAFVDTMVTKYETLLEANAGIRSVSVDGQAITYEELHRRWEFWKAWQAREKGTRPRSVTLDLGNSFG